MASINTNIASSRTASLLNIVTRDLYQTSQRIATGKRINSAADDPAGIGVVAKMKAQYSSYNAVQKNLSAGKTLLDVAGSSLQTQQSIMQKMKELAVEGSSGTLSAEQRTALNDTFTQLRGQLDTAVNDATVFGQNLTSSSAANVALQSGINAGDQFTLTAVKSDTTTLALKDIDLSDATKAAAAITALDTAVGTVGASQANIGAQQKVLAFMAENAQNTQDNLEASIGTVEDADIAKETAKLQQLQTKMQLGTAMMSITNSLPNYLLQLLR